MVVIELPHVVDDPGHEAVVVPVRDGDMRPLEVSGIGEVNTTTFFFFFFFFLAVLKHLSKTPRSG